MPGNRRATEASSPIVALAAATYQIPRRSVARAKMPIIEQHHGQPAANENFGIGNQSETFFGRETVGHQHQRHRFSSAMWTISHVIAPTPPLGKAQLFHGGRTIVVEASGA